MADILESIHDRDITVMRSANEYYKDLVQTHPDAARQFWRQVKTRIFGDYGEQQVNFLLLEVEAKDALLEDELREVMNGD